MGKWVTADEWETITEDNYTYYETDMPHIHKNYGLFGYLANVRREIVNSLGDPKGLPEDVSSEVKRASDAYGIDGHSHSWVNLHTLKLHLMENLINPSEHFPWYQESLQEIVRLFDNFKDDEEEFRFVFWFDN